MERFWPKLGIIACFAAIVAGCTRNVYRIRADNETASILAEKTWHAPWAPPPGYNPYPDPRSRFFNPTNPNDPLLPIPAPKLYAYELPELPERDRSRFNPSKDERQGDDPENCDPGGETQSQPAPPAQLLPAPPANDAASTGAESSIQFAHYLQADEAVDPPDDSAPTDLSSPDALDAGELTVAPIPQDVWESLPDSCLLRMFEFDSIRDEYARSFGQAPDSEERNAARRLALEDIVCLALINSREYQTQKELLYRVALRLTLERYDYDLKFSPFGNGTDVNFVHDRTQGRTVNTLAIPTRVSGEKMLATGGNFLAQFANDVVLTFNGPDGFAADVGSELLFSFSQNVLQRDILLENLTQAERDVVYAARDFARFRKVFFRNLAAQYYSLLLAYRGIEIEAQNYFSNLRGFNQGQAEYRAGRLPRIQVDQFEQTALRSRSSLIGQCNGLESALDNLKLAIGIPPETPINLDLTELESLTLRDETTVSAELVRRARRNLLQERSVPAPDRSTLLNFAIDLTRRMLNLAELRGRLGEESEGREALELELAQLLVEESQLLVQFNREILAEEQRAMPPAPPLRIFQRTMDLVGALLDQAERQLDLAARRDAANGPALEAARQTAAELAERFELLRAQLESVVERRELARIPALVTDAQALLTDADILVTQMLPREAPLDPATQQREMLRRADELLAASQNVLGDAAEGLAPIEIDMDEAMLTALTQRFDLMNERGVLADAWRQIKFAGDDLRSILNLNATQIIRTRSDVNRPFDFTFDESQTRLSASFDAPLNRKAQRNAFRVALMNYNVGLRSLIELEDTIKFNVRDDLRDLQLDREQYRIAVASAALAYERVVSTRLQLRLGVENVAARDFLEAQQAYAASLSSVAQEHTGYIVDRIDLFLDLELLEVNAEGFWPGLYQEEMQPQPNLHWPPRGMRHPYGELPQRTLPSRKIRRMLHVPPGQPTIFNATPDADRGHSAPREEIPTPPGEPE